MAVMLIAYVIAAFGLSRGVDVAGSPGNAFFDMDTGRVISDWTSWDGAERARTHPLYKYLALVGEPLGRAVGATTAARLLCIAGLLATALAAGMLARELSGGDTRAGLIAMAITGSSFCFVLLAAIPDSAALAGLFGALPMLLLYRQRHCAMPPWEIIAWIALAVGSFGVTISQFGFFAVAFAARLAWLPGGWKPRAACGAAVLVIGVLVAWGLLELQARTFETRKYYKINRIVAQEFKFFETEELRAEPLWRGANLLSHFAAQHFVAPQPVVARWSPPRDPARSFLSLTIVDSGWRHFAPWQWPLLLSHAALLVFVAARARWRREFWPLALVLAGQLAMHFIYGREWVIYAPNWHGVLVALLVALVAREIRLRPPVVAWLAIHAALLLAVNVATLGNIWRMYDEEFPIEEARSLILPAEDE